ncbi:hypothetical protein BGZ57DRAFT_848453 [Hyaloscypha finlandica]|nr:hypothetical protein BGZ57DRAFT_848453 [Hyaloscypha finlandica]
MCLVLAGVVPVVGRVLSWALFPMMAKQGWYGADEAGSESQFFFKANFFSFMSKSIILSTLVPRSQILEAAVSQVLVVVRDYGRVPVLDKRHQLELRSIRVLEEASPRDVGWRTIDHCKRGIYSIGEIASCYSPPDLDYVAYR